MKRQHLSSHGDDVLTFMRLAGQEVPELPVLPPVEVRLLRARLLLEEVFETIEALGCAVLRYGRYGQSVQVEYSDLKLDPIGPGNLVQIVDGCADVRVVATGCLLACGVGDESVQPEVDAANLRKFGTGGYRDAGGKWIKPPDFVPPDLAAVLRQLGWKQ